MQPGEEVRAEIHTTGSLNSVQLSGRAIASQRLEGEAKRYRVAVRFGDDGDGGISTDEKLGSSIDEAMNALLSDVTVFRQREMRSEGTHLQGELSQVSLPSLLSFLDLEQTAGVLELSRGAAHGKLHVREGRIVHVEMQPPGSAPRSIQSSHRHPGLRQASFVQ